MNKSSLLLFLFYLCSTSVSSQKLKYNHQNGFVAKDYDLVEYFNGSAIKGKKDYIIAFKGSKFKFSSQENLKKFKRNPKTYLPQYGGWCAYAIAHNGKKYRINPKSFEVRDGKLYLFYRSAFWKIYERWLKEDPKMLISNADKNWKG